MTTQGTSSAFDQIVGLAIMVAIGLALWQAAGWYFSRNDDDPEKIAEQAEREAVSTCRLHHMNRGVEFRALGGSKVEHRRGVGYRVVLETKAGDYRRCTVLGGSVVDAN